MNGVRNMERFIAVPDIHGKNQLLQALLNNIKPAKQDSILFLGDYIDRTEAVRGVIETINCLKEKCIVIPLRGNHEELFLGYARTIIHKYPAINKKYQRQLDDYPFPYWYSKDNALNLWLANGGDKTIESFKSQKEMLSVLMPFISSLLPYFETDETIFVHGGVPCGKNLHNAELSDLLWERNGCNNTKKMVIVGHSIVSEPVLTKENVFYLDTGAFKTGILTAYDVTNDNIIQVKSHDVRPIVKRRWAK